ncbi:zinc-finger domain-containing protein [Luteithermobacter gelatinilyticus]|uniref:zinc-finger domain-containing protein n=1 Tax=Luteithermobacter gelatinilyticus TaxID=2582913 RepID=UPI001106166B|nr:zinc-finger domain-containing protein [Luteithermobacter gelatinilyticus]|tara:strand:- start:15427 stop:15645 length:219 start_codon:yes stop_codon:yes gene_type:complete
MNKETPVAVQAMSPDAILNQDIVLVDDHRVSCNGGEGPLGHPLIYLEMAGRKEVTCPYCSRKFVTRERSENR